MAVIPYIRTLKVTAAFMFVAATTTTPVTAQAQPTAIPVAFFGELRARSEWDNPTGPVKADEFTYLRSRFGIRVDAAPTVQIVLQMQDSRVLGGEGNGLPANVASIDLHQAYVSLVAPWRGTNFRINAGRQEIAFSNERLVGVSNWTNTGRSFDGVRVMMTPGNAKAGVERWTATAFAATVEEHGRHFGTAADAAPSGIASSQDHALAAVLVTRRAGPALLEGTALYDAGMNYRSVRHANRGTLDAHMTVADAHGLRAEFEGAVQLGHQSTGPDTSHLHSQSVNAWLLSARLGNAARASARTSGALGVDVLSGDATPSDGRYSTFSTMFASNHGFYGLEDVIGDPGTTTRDRGLVDLLATLRTRVSGRVAARAELHQFTMAAGANRALGWEADLLLPVRLNTAADVELGYSAFRAGSGASAVGVGTNGSMRHWLYLQLRAGF